MAVPACRYVNLSRSPSGSRSNLGDVDMDAVHIQLRTDDADDAATDEPHHRTDASNDDNQSTLPPTPVCGGYIVVGPDTFGRFDAATGRFINTDSGIETDYSLRQLCDDGRTDSAVASGQNHQNSDLTVAKDSHQQSSGDRVIASDRLGASDVSGVQGNSSANDSTPVTNYAMIMGMDSELGDSECCAPSVGQTHNPDNSTAGEELPPIQSASDEEQHDDLAVPFEVSSPPVCYSLNSGGYLSHSELLGATPAV